MDADLVNRHVAAWRVAEGISQHTLGLTPPTVTYEGPERFGPWEDVVERRNDGEPSHVYQVKSGARIAVEEFKELIVSLRTYPSAEATLVVTDSPHIGGMPVTLKAIASAVRAVQSGASLDPRQHDDPAACFFLSTCGTADEALSVASKLTIDFAGNREALIVRSMKALREVYDDGVAHSVYNEILSAIDGAVGYPIAIETLLKTRLAGFQRLARRVNVETVRSDRSSYLIALREAIQARRVLRLLEQTGDLLENVWITPRLRLAGGDVVDVLTLPSLFHEGEEHNVVGSAGSGKTELLARLAATLASVAERDASAPMPLVLGLRDLEGGTDSAAIARAAEQFARGAGAALGRVLDIPGVSWVLLLDGVDEVRLGAELVAAIRRRLHSPTSVATLRPSVLRTMSPASTFWLERWRDADASHFLRQFAIVHPQATQNLMQLTSDVPGLLESPLTATLTALVATYSGSTPANRTQLFDQATQILVQRWAAARGVDNPWRTVGSTLRTIALGVVQNERSSISEVDLGRKLRLLAPDESLLVKQCAERDFGILVRVGDGFEFLVRGMAEFLAAELLAETEADLAHACGEAWAQDTARHALVLLSARHSATFTRLLTQLLNGDTQSSRGLRGLLVAIAACADCTNLSADLTQMISERCVEEMRNEESPWRSDRVADAVAEFAASGAPAWRVLRTRIQAVLHDPRSPAEHFASEPRDSALSARMLRHCDPAVRAEGVRRLDPSNPASIDLLFIMLHDAPTFPHWDRTPAIEAALALRAAPRSLLSEYLPVLRALSETSSQLLSAAAASVLRPGEQECSALVSAYRRGADGQFLPSLPVTELASDIEGLAALDRLWPEWQSYAELRPIRAEQVRPRVSEEPPPPSDLARARLLRVLGKERIDARDVSTDLLRNPGWELYLEAICDNAIKDPSVVSPVMNLAPHSFPFVSYRASLMLADAASRHERVRDQLLELWHRFNTDPKLNSRFPGRGLEHLVVNGDELSTEVYAAWLPYAPFLSGAVDEPGPDPDVFRSGIIRETATALLAGVVSRATTGFEERGQHFVVSALAAARVFRICGTVWRGDDTVTAPDFHGPSGPPIPRSTSNPTPYSERPHVSLHRRAAPLGDQFAIDCCCGGLRFETRAPR